MYKCIKAASRRIKLDKLDSQVDAAAVFVFQKAKRLSAGLKNIDGILNGKVAEVIKRDEFSAGVGNIAISYEGTGLKRVFVVGLGEENSFTGNQLRIAASKLLKAADAAGIKKIAIFQEGALEKVLDEDTFGNAVGDGLGQANYIFDDFKGAAKVSASKKDKQYDLSVATTSAVSNKAIAKSLMVAEGVNTAKKLAAMPPNVGNVKYIETYCRKMAKNFGLKCSVINAAKAKQLQMGGLLAVGAGSKTPPALIILEWPGKANQKSNTKPTLLVGKTLTFDSGGYSLKPDGGKNMKYDKCGGMTLIGIMETVARLGLKQRVVGIIAAAENMIDSEAYRVDDILKFTNGVTCEVTNTDAEGRLVLADALAYGTKKYNPKAVLDLATLTGGVIVALGSYCAGVFSTDKKLSDEIAKSANATGERVWELPLWDEHRNQMKGNHADLVNSSNREAHPIQGAAFLSYFVGDKAPMEMPKLPWMHIDIAGVASFDSETPMYAKGPSGWGVRLITDYLSNQ